MNRKEDTVFCYYAHNSVWTCELCYGADTMCHRTYFLFMYSSINFWRLKRRKIIPTCMYVNIPV